MLIIVLPLLSLVQIQVCGLLILILAGEFISQAISCVILTSSLDGMHACPGENVVYTCEVHNGITLQFSSTKFDADPIRFTRSDEIEFSAQRGPFQATLTDVNIIGAFTANFSAQLSATVTMDLNGSLIECSGGGEAKNTTLLVNEHPGPPTGVNILVQEEVLEGAQCRSRPVSISWHSPNAQDTLSYTVTITSNASSAPFRRNTRVPKLNVTLQVGNYTVNITAINIRCQLSSETASTEYEVPAISHCGIVVPPEDNTNYDSNQWVTPVFSTLGSLILLAVVAAIIVSIIVLYKKFVDS